MVVTASHNPKEYNGYKAYWTDGAQVTPPHDKNIIAEVEKITDVDMILTGRNPENITILDEKFDEIYLDKVHELSLSPESVKKHHDMKIVYTPLHGSGVRLVPASLSKFGFTNVTLVPEQAVVDGNFPTVESPNPEERKTMSMAIDLAAREGADLVLATDPDSDRIGVALRNKRGEYVLLNGNQTLVLLMSYQLTRWAERGELDGNQYVVKTIVTSQMANAVADYFKVKCYDCLTGFKYIAKIIRENEGKTKYIGGGEESFGYLAGDYVRDKDAVSACSLAAEAAAWAMDTMGLTLYEWLQQLYVKYGFYREGLVSVVRKGKEGAELIQKMMVDFRTNPPKTICGSPVVKVNDFLSLEQTDLRTGARTPIEQDSSNVLQWFTEDGTIVSVRPSGTEPKIKFYFGVKGAAGFGGRLREGARRTRRQDRGDQEGPEAGVTGRASLPDCAGARQSGPGFCCPLLFLAPAPFALGCRYAPCPCCVLSPAFRTLLLVWMSPRSYIFFPARGLPSLPTADDFS